MAKYGRPRKTKLIEDLLMARMSILDGLTFVDIAKKFGLASKNSVSLRLMKLKEKAPEYIQGLTNIRDYHEEKQIEIPEGNRTNLDKLKVQSLPDTIREKLYFLLDLTEEEIRSMKPEHRLRNVESLIKSMRLLQEKSTSNVQQLSLIKCIGIATERRKPQK